MVGHQQWHRIWVLRCAGGKYFHAGEERHVLVGVRRLEGCFIGLLLQSMSLLSTNVLCCIISLLFLYHLHWINSRDANEFKWLSNSQYSNYSDSNTSWTPGEPSEVPLGTSTTTSAIKIGVVAFLFSAFGRTPDPWFGILVPPPPWCVPRSQKRLDFYRGAESKKNHLLQG